MAYIQQGAGNIPQRFWSILTWYHHRFICRLQINDANLSFHHTHPKDALFFSPNFKYGVYSNTHTHTRTLYPFFFHAVNFLRY